EKSPRLSNSIALRQADSLSRTEQSTERSASRFDGSPISRNFPSKRRCRETTFICDCELGGVIVPPPRESPVELPDFCSCRSFPGVRATWAQKNHIGFYMSSFKLPLLCFDHGEPECQFAG